MSTRLILIRHGQTEWSVDRRYCGISDIDLNDSGRVQADRVSHRLKEERIQKVYSSASKRALNFAKIAFKDISIEKLSNLREINFGIFEGLKHEDIIKKHPDIYSAWLNDPFQTTIPKGDNLGDFEERIKETLVEIISLNRDNTVGIVTHGGVIRMILKDLLHEKSIWSIKLPHLASITIVEYKDNKGEVLLFNDKGHLNE
ncbi:MAG: histidine phosphatase family protein [Candidatus Omnitrophota bacterium]